MMRSIFSRVVRVGRATTFSAGVALMLALTVGLASTAVAGTGVGAVFNLGKINSVNALSALTGSVNGAMLRISNTNTGFYASGLEILTSSAKPPMKVNSGVKVNNLNTDRLDGYDSSAFLKTSGKAADSDKLDGKDSTEFAAGVDGKANDSDKLDGLDSTTFGITTEHNYVRSASCDTPNTYNQCAKVQVVVPAGKTYLVSVWSTANWLGGSTEQTVSYCSARDGSCITPFGHWQAITLPANKRASGASEGETLTLTEGTYTFSTVVFTYSEVASDYYSNVFTKVLVRDADNPGPTGVTLVQ